MLKDGVNAQQSKLFSDFSSLELNRFERMFQLWKEESQTFTSLYAELKSGEVEKYKSYKNLRETYPQAVPITFAFDKNKQGSLTPSSGHSKPVARKKSCIIV